MSKNPVIDKYGTKRWFNKEGQFHRLNGPAAECNNGTKHWYKNGKRHRLDGPAVEYSDGDKEYYIDGKKLTEEEFIDKTQLVKYLSNIKPQNRWDALYEE